MIQTSFAHLTNRWTIRSECHFVSAQSQSVVGRPFVQYKVICALLVWHLVLSMIEGTAYRVLLCHLVCERRIYNIARHVQNLSDLPS